MKTKVSILSLLTIFFSSLVTAGPVQGVEQLLTGLGQIIVVLIRFISDTIFNIDSFDEFLFARILLFSIILLIVYTVIKNNPILGDNKAIHWIISSSIAILSIRFLSDNFIQAILLQYGALAVGVTVFLPWAIYFFFIHQSGTGPFGRRVGWIVFATAFFAMWSFRATDLGDANWLYGIGVMFILISFLFDSKIHKYFQLHELKSMGSIGRINRRLSAEKELEELENTKSRLNKKDYNKLREHWMKIYTDNA